MIRVRDHPGVWWLLAALFIGVGAGFVYIGLSRGTRLEWWQAPLATLMGAAAVAAGVWWAWRSPLSTVAVSPSEQHVRLVQIGLFGKRVQVVPFPRIEDVVVERQSDDEGGAVARPALLLRDGRIVPLSALWQHDVKGISKAVAALRAGLRASPPVESSPPGPGDAPVEHRPFAGLDDEIKDEIEDDVEGVRPGQPKEEGPPS